MLLLYDIEIYLYKKPPEYVRGLLVPKEIKIQYFLTILNFIVIIYFLVCYVPNA